MRSLLQRTGKVFSVELDARETGDNRVLVIGGGLAGASAAIALARVGVPVTLVETKNRLGGRVGSYTDQTTGQSIDYCQHVGMSCCTNLRRLIQWLGQEDQWHLQKELHFFDPGQQRRTLRALPYLPAPVHLAAWLWNWPGLNLAERIGIARTMFALNRVPLVGPRASMLDDTSALEWLRLRGQSDRALERFWATIVVSALGEELGRVGLLPMAKVFQDGFLRSVDAFHLLIPQRPLADLFGRQMESALTAAGVEVLLGTSVRGAQWAGPRCQAITLSDGRRIAAASVVIAVPWYAVKDVVADCPDAPVQQVAARANQLHSSPISGIHTWWDRAWLPASHAVLVGRQCQWIFPTAVAPQIEIQQHADLDSGIDPMTEHYYQVVISASRCLPRGDIENVRRMIEEDLRAVFPEARSARLVRLKVVTDPQAVFSVTPGTDRLRPPAGSQLGNLFWAGDWVQTGWPATMESAVLSGFSAAQAIAKERGRA